LTLLIYNDDVFIDHFWTIYFLSIRVKTQHSSASLVATYACQVLALMRIKPEGEDVTSEDKFDNEAPPAMYIVLLFVRAFDRAWFRGHFNFRMRNNPNFGKGTYGFMSPYCVEHTYVMNRDLEHLENDGYKTHPAFAPFMKAVAVVPQNDGVSKAGSAYFQKFPEVFFGTFRHLFDKHITSRWTDNQHLCYAIAGSPDIAKAMLQFINSTERTLEEIEGDNDEEATDEGKLLCSSL
jgi:hypothetical protein